MPGHLAVCSLHTVSVVKFLGTSSSKLFLHHESDTTKHRLLLVFARPEENLTAVNKPACLQMYAPFCKDFGPVNIPLVITFCEHIAERMNRQILQHRPLIFYSGHYPEDVTNNVFLLCAYLIIKEGFTVERALSCFEDIEDLPILPFRDPTSRQTYGL